MAPDHSEEGREIDEKMLWQGISDILQSLRKVGYNRNQPFIRLPKQLEKDLDLSKGQDVLIQWEEDNNEVTLVFQKDEAENI
jgi:hypothetical protein